HRGPRRSRASAATAAESEGSRTLVELELGGVVLVLLAQLGDAMGQTPTVGGGDVEPAHNGVGLVIGLRPTEVFSELAHALSVVGADSHKNSMALVEQGESDTHRPGRRP